MAFTIDLVRVVKFRLSESAVAEHHLETGHHMEFSETKYFVKTFNYFPRNIRESIEIINHPLNLNRGLGTRPFLKTRRQT